ncbi:hypothetical protein [uncultured Pelagimonas sp.]|nr:hypothetical protein [uncultured Pelagimonas sp.]
MAIVTRTLATVFTPFTSFYSSAKAAWKAGPCPAWTEYLHEEPKR